MISLKITLFQSFFNDITHNKLTMPNMQSIIQFMYDIVIATAKYIERGLNKFMQKHSKLWILFHHPFGVVGRTILVLFVILVLLESQSIYVGETASKILLCISFFIGLCLTQRKYNREEMYPSQKPKKKHSLDSYFHLLCQLTVQ